MYILIDSFRNCILPSVEYLLQISVRGVDLAYCFIPVSWTVDVPVALKNPQTVLRQNV